MRMLTEKAKEYFSTFSWKNYFFTFVFGLLAVLILRYHGSDMPSVDYGVGDIAREDVYAPRDMNIIDRDATMKRRKEAADNVNAVYDFNNRENQRVLERLKEAFQTARKMSIESGESAAVNSAIRKKFESGLGVQLSDMEFRVLLLNRFSVSLDNALRKIILANTNGLDIVSSKELLLPELNKGIVRRTIQGKEVSKEETVDDFSGIYELEEVRSLMKKRLDDILGYRYKYSRPHLLSLSQKSIRPTLTFNQAETENRRQNAFDSDNNIVPIIIRKGAIVVRSGNVIDARQVTILKGHVGEERR